ncbi:MAG: hypothetical protein GXY23_00655 [Myxococcales bacterium]|nr:hypothetical protein [Myxococcales bacterium]
MKFQHAYIESKRAKMERLVHEAKRSGPGGLAIPLLTLAVVLGLIALNVFLPGFLGNPMD